MQLNTTWKSIPTLKTLKVREYGTVSVSGQIAYKVSSHDRANLERATSKGWRECGSGSSYLYVTRGEPSKVRDMNTALQLASGYSVSLEGQYQRVTLYVQSGAIYSTVRDVPDVPALKAKLEAMGKAEVKQP